MTDTDRRTEPAPIEVAQNTTLVFRECWIDYRPAPWWRRLLAALLPPR